MSDFYPRATREEPMIQKSGRPDLRFRHDPGVFGDVTCKQSVKDLWSFGMTLGGREKIRRKKR